MREDDYSFFEEDQFKETLAAYENMVSSGTPTYMGPDELTDIAEYYVVNNRREEAMKCIDYALSLHPDAVDPMVFLARQHMFEGNTQKARTICESINDQSDREVIFLKAEILIREGQADKAFDLLFRTYEQLQEEQDVFLNDCIDICYDYYYNEKGLEWARLLYQEFPDYEDRTMVLADMLVLNGKNDEALTLLDKELDESPYNVKAWLLLTDALCGKGNYNHALDAADFALAINPTEEHAMLVKANCYFHLNKMEEAHRQYVEYQKLYPADDNGLYLDGLCLINMERFPEAVSQLEKALEMDHTRSGLGLQICSQLAYALSKLGKASQALDVLERGDEFKTPDDRFEKELMRGHIFLENGMEREAYREFQIAVEKSSDPNITWLTIAISMCECQLYDESAGIMENLESTLSDEQLVLALPYMAYSYYYLQRWPDFLRCLPLAVEKNRETTEYLFSPIYPGKKPEEYVETAMLHIREQEGQ